MTVLENNGRNKLQPLPLAINCVEIEHLKEEQLRRKMKKRSNYARFIVMGRDGNEIRVRRSRAKS
jgi:hypothetical protein